MTKLPAKLRLQILLISMIGIGGTGFATGLQLSLTFSDGNGWWKVGVGVFSILGISFSLWSLLKRDFFIEND
jgi:hypothetical protein